MVLSKRPVYAILGVIMKKSVQCFTAALLSAASFSAIAASQAKAVPSIGIVVPLEHRAMTEVVNGFKTELAKKYHHPVTVVVKNAQGDQSLQRSIVSQFKAQGVSMIEPIGTDSFEMTLAQVKDIPVMGIAAEFTQAQRQQLRNKQVTAVIDELDPAVQLQFMQQAIPKLKKITVLYSADGKIFAEVKQLEQAAKKAGISVQKLMVSSSPELYTMSQHVADDSQAIFILKDHLIVNGIATIVQQAEKKHIAVISSDDGSVQGGAAFALGVRERQIGIKSADVTAAFLNGKPLKDIPITRLTHYNVFINPQQAKAQGVDIKQLQAVAKKEGYGVVNMTTST